MAYPVELRNNLNDELPDGTPVKRYYAFQELCLEVLYETYAQLRVDYARLTGEIAITDSLPPGSREDDDPQVVRDVMRMGFVPAYPEEAAEAVDEIEQILQLPLSDEVLKEYLFSRYHLVDHPGAERKTMRAWLAEIRDALMRSVTERMEWSDLRARQRRIAKYLARGLNNAEIVAETGDLYAESAVERVVRSLMFDTKSPTREALLEWIAEHRPDRPQQ